jgi:hypothetical protein
MMRKLADLLADYAIATCIAAVLIGLKLAEDIRDSRK